MDKKIKIEHDHTDESVSLSDWLPLATFSFLMGLFFAGLAVFCLREGFFFHIPTVAFSIIAIVLIAFAALVGNSATTKDRW